MEKKKVLLTEEDIKELIDLLQVKIESIEEFKQDSLKEQDMFRFMTSIIVSNFQLNDCKKLLDKLQKSLQETVYMEKLDEFCERFSEEQLVADLSDTLTALKSYNFFLLQVSKSKMRSRKERKNALDDIKVIERLIKNYELLLEDLKYED